VAVLVFFVNHSTAPVSLGGAERSLLALVEHWYAADDDFEAFFITKHPRGQFTAALDARGWAYESIRFRGWAGPRADPPVQELAYFARQDYAAVLRCIRLMEGRRPDLVVTNTLVAPWGAFAAKVLDIPHAWMVREYGDLDHGLVFTSGRDATLADIGLLSDVVFTNSEGLRDHLAPHIPAEKLAVVYPQIDVDAVVEAAQERPRHAPFPGGHDGELLVTCVGRLLPGKGQWLVIDALAELVARGVPARLCLVGSAVEAEYRQSLADRATALGVGDRVTFAGEQQNPFPFVAAADVCVTASDIEAFGRTTAEYLALGKPVVAFRNGGSLELVVDGVTGMLVDPEAAAIATALAAYAGDADLRARHGGTGHRHVRDLLARHDHGAALERLRAVAAAGSGYRLPAIARHWFAIPGIVSEASSRGITLRFVLARGREAARRLGRRAKRVVVGPPIPQPKNLD
jgi:glycosyltransferase involved in cell wall biosynthesis